RKRSLAGELVAGVDGVSSSAVTELFRRLSLAPDVVFDQLNAETLDLLAAEGDRLIASAGEVRFYADAGVVSSLSLLGLGESRPATEEDETAMIARYEREYRRATLAARLRGELDRISGRRRKAARDKADAMDKAAGADDLMHAGQLLLASTDVRGAAPASITLPEGLTVPLDPETSRLVNAQRLFERAKRNRRAREHAGMLDELIASLDADYDELAAAMAPDAPLGTLSNLHARHVESERPTAEGGRVLPAKVGRRVLPGGFTLYWGRDGRANQFVTFQLARPGDVWFHVQQGAGAHVVVRRPDREAPLPLDVIVEAAGLALRNSTMRTSAHVPVVYTERRYVRHRRGALGSVFYEREKVIYVDGGA
ncbi:MAG: NFACT RNA binding domain-containing protein, partial [bacterium]|nr:NFACT RNA binding domain-containing protein [bacterium]